MAAQLRHDLGVFVGGVVVQDGVDELSGGTSAFDGIEETNELLMPVPLPAAADGRAVQHVKATPA